MRGIINHRQTLDYPAFRSGDGIKSIVIRLDGALKAGLEFGGTH